MPGEKGNDRFNYIAERIDKGKNNVEILISSFSHATKSHRNVDKEKVNKTGYKLSTLYEPGYKKNVSIKRLYSHFILGNQLKKYLKTRKKPDVIYCGVPSLDVAKVAAKYAKKNNVRFIIDIQDLWPEAFKMVLNVPIISNILFYPMKKQANYIYKQADEVVAVSQTYADRGLKSNTKCESGYSVYLGTELNYFDQLANGYKNKDKLEDEIWLAYIGTLGHSYDLIPVIDALKKIKDYCIGNIKFVVMGDGPLGAKFEDYSRKQNIYANFTGRLDYGDMVGVLATCDIAINPIKKNSAGSIINKVGDYAAAGLPVINTQESDEYRSLLEEYNAGYNCVNGDSEDIAEKLSLLIKNENARKEMGEGNRKLAEEKFDRECTYKKILEIIDNS